MGRCLNCIHFDACDTDRHEKERLYGDCSDFLNDVDVAEVKHGKFIKRTPCSEPECDQCGKCPKLVFGMLPNYCPHCGAKMDGEK